MTLKQMGVRMDTESPEYINVINRCKYRIIVLKIALLLKTVISISNNVGRTK